MKALVQYIRGEGLELFEKPKPPQNESSLHRMRKRPDDAESGAGAGNKQDHQATTRNYDTDPEWLAYCEWVQALNKQAIDQFLRGIQIGVQLGESWLVSQGSAYVWNYLHYKIEKRQFVQLIPVLGECLDGLRKIGHNSEPELLVAISVAQANGLMQNWLPSEQVRSLQVPSLGAESPSGTEKHTKKPNLAAANQPAKVQFSLTAEAQADIKKALEVGYWKWLN